MLLCVWLMYCVVMWLLNCWLWSVGQLSGDVMFNWYYFRAAYIATPDWTILMPLLLLPWWVTYLCCEAGNLVILRCWPFFGGYLPDIFALLRTLFSSSFCLFLLPATGSGGVVPSIAENADTGVAVFGGNFYCRFNVGRTTLDGHYLFGVVWLFTLIVVIGPAVVELYPYGGWPDGDDHYLVNLVVVRVAKWPEPVVRRHGDDTWRHWTAAADDRWADRTGTATAWRRWAAAWRRVAVLVTKTYCRR